MAQSLKACLAFLILMAFVRSNQATVPCLHFIVLKVEMKFVPPAEDHYRFLYIRLDSPIPD